MKRFLRRLALLVLSLFLLVIVGGAAWLYQRSRASLPRLDGTIQVSGLAARFEVLRDARGVPHIRAQSVADALFAQGYVTAQDRLWQMDLSRRLAEGQLSEIFGDRTLRYDIEGRTMGLHRVAERALTELDPDTRRLLNSYARGVNAFITSHRRHLPI
ncbi:MAG: penicillin acylase family protein, partial [Terriglobia bacterium]